ncbi:MAG: hypothetical protein KDA80_15300 [Planctomycetaceae bacterium]|nr:hypothetical protein [Planctomycetaceae bacterium]
MFYTDGQKLRQQTEAMDLAGPAARVGLSLHPPQLNQGEVTVKTRKRMFKKTLSGFAVVTAAGLTLSSFGTPDAWAEPLLQRLIDGPRQSAEVQPQSSPTKQPTYRSASQSSGPGAVTNGQYVTGTPQQNAQVQNAYREDETRESSGNLLTGFFDRLRQTFRRDSASRTGGPPEDPGMTYPTASNPKAGQSARKPAMAPPASVAIGGADIPPVPPSIESGPPPVPGASLPSSQPGLFNPAVSATPIGEDATQNVAIGESAIPPIEELGIPSDPIPLPAPGEPGSGANAPAESVAEADIPSLPPAMELNTPVEKSAPVTEVPSAETPKSDEPIESSVAQAPPRKPTADPFDNLFPADRQNPDTAGSESPKGSDSEVEPEEKSSVVAMPEPAPEESPFTGQALEGDLVEKVSPNMPPLESATANSQATDVAKDDAPSLDLSLPSDMPKLPPIDLPPAEGPAPETVPGAEVADADSTGLKATGSPPQALPSPESAPIVAKPSMDVSTAETEAASKAPTAERTEVQVAEAPRELPVSPKAKPTPEESTPTTQGDATQAPQKSEHQSKMQKIAARKELKGLKGFCPVVLRDHRDLVDASPDYEMEFEGKTYRLSSAAALEVFRQNPAKYAPAAQGNDVIHQALAGEDLLGSLDYAVWYRDRLYLFSSVETMETFVAAPSSHAVE